MDRCGELLAGDVLLSLWSNFLEDERSLAAFLCRGRLPASTSASSIAPILAAPVATPPKIHSIGKSGGAGKRCISGPAKVSPTATAAASARCRRPSTRFLRFNTSSSFAAAAARRMSNGAVCRTVPALVARPGPNLVPNTAADLRAVVDEEAASDVSIGMPAPPADLEDIDERDVHSGLLDDADDSLYSNKFL